MYAEAAKRCGCCGECKPVSEFHRNPSGRDGLHSFCRVCKIRSTTAKRYQISMDEVARLWGIEECQACGAPIAPGRRQIDHCHELGHVRGVLCLLCNHACAGKHIECIDRLAGCIEYLKRDLERQREQG